MSFVPGKLLVLNVHKGKEQRSKAKTFSPTAWTVDSGAVTSLLLDKQVELKKGLMPAAVRGSWVAKKVLKGKAIEIPACG